MAVPTLRRAASPNDRLDREREDQKRRIRDAERIAEEQGIAPRMWT